MELVKMKIKHYREKLSMYLLGINKIDKRNIVSSLDDLNIIVFWKIVRDGNIYLLDKEFHEDKKYKDIDTKVLMETWSRLQDEYYNLDQDASKRNAIRKSFEFIKLQFKYSILANQYELYCRMFQFEQLIGTKSFIEKENDVKNTFKELGFTQPLLKFNTPHENAEIFKRYLSSLTNSVLTAKKNLNQKVDKQIENYYDQVVQVEQVLERSIGDVDKITVTKWLSYIKQAKQISDAKRKISNGKK